MSNLRIVRCFIVGCPRSGTTLLQAMLGAHFKVFTLPESHFFEKSLMGRRAFVFRGFRASKALHDWLIKIGLAQYSNEIPKFSFTRRPVIDAFVKIMDNLACQNENTVWLEKTPSHIFVVDAIERYIPDGRFIHIVRDGRAVVASLYEAIKKYPRVWGNRSLIELVELWNKAIKESARHVGKENHFFVRYETLTTQPTKSLMEICQFLSLEFEKSMLEGYRKAAHKVILSGEEWVRRACEPIAAPSLVKYETVFSENERQFLERKLIPIPEILKVTL